MRQVAILVTAAALTVAAQQVTIPFSGGGGTPTLRITLLDGAIEIHGYDGKELVLDSSGSGRRKDRREERTGLHRIDIANGYSVSQEGNVVTIHGSGDGSPHLSLQVPF